MCEDGRVDAILSVNGYQSTDLVITVTERFDSDEAELHAWVVLLSGELLQRMSNVSQFVVSLADADRFAVRIEPSITNSPTTTLTFNTSGLSEALSEHLGSCGLASPV